MSKWCISVKEADGHTGLGLRREVCVSDQSDLCVISRWVIIEAMRLLESIQWKYTEWKETRTLQYFSSAISIEQWEKPDFRDEEWMEGENERVRRENSGKLSFLPSICVRTEHGFLVLIGRSKKERFRDIWWSLFSKGEYEICSQVQGWALVREQVNSYTATRIRRKGWEWMLTTNYRWDSARLREFLPVFLSEAEGGFWQVIQQEEMTLEIATVET